MHDIHQVLINKVPTKSSSENLIKDNKISELTACIIMGFLKKYNLINTMYVLNEELNDVQLLLKNS